MLVISRRKGQRIAIGDEIELVVTELHRSSVKLGIRAPRGYAVLRGEVRDSIEEANREAAETVFETMELDTSIAAASPGKAPTDLLKVRQTAGEGVATPAASASGPEVIVRRRPVPKESPVPAPGDSVETP